VTFTLTPLISLFIGGLVAVLIAVGYILASNRISGSFAAAAALSAGFATFTGITIWQEGVLLVLENHTTNLWGVQVWWDLLFAVGIGLFLIAPRARKQGMNLPLWTLFVVLTASIGLLAMCARLFWLEQASGSEKAPAQPAGAKPAVATPAT
jgi:hypothetical protein